MTTIAYTLAEIAERIGATLIGDGERVVSGLQTLQAAGPGELSFLANPAYARYLPDTRAEAVILSPNQADACPVSALLMNNPYVGYARVSQMMEAQQVFPWAIHESAVVDASALLGKGCQIGPGSVIGAGARIGAGSRIGAGCVIGEGVQLGENALLHPRVTLYPKVQVGANAIFHAGSVIGSDGFGFAPEGGRFEKIAQLGRVIIGDDVEIGANTTIDRGAIGDTVIEDGVKLDNQIQIAHNVRVGAHTVIAACAGISGSSEIGQHCMIGGGVGVAGHLKIANGVHLTGMTLVTHDLKEAGVYSSGTAVEANRSWRRNVARFRQLDQWIKRLQKLERQGKQ